MKILRLRFKNINSFYGEHEPIDFTTNPLSTTGLFIISGQTGAGKSTLLDVITLALYNEIPRFKSISKNEIDKQGSIVNLRAAEEPKTDAYAEVEFQVASGKYRSRWSILKNRNGKWNNYAMEIASLPDEKLLEVKGLSDYPKKNAELIGLTYDQFIKSIILAQGSFSEFLKADRNTRGKLLEDITGTHVYREIGVRAFEMHKNSQSKLTELEAEMRGVDLLTPESLTALKGRVTTLEVQTDKAKVEQTLWEKEWGLAQLISTRKKRQIELEQGLSVLETNKVAFENEAIRLAQHEEIADSIESITTLREKGNTHLKLIKSKVDFEEEIKRLEFKVSEHLEKVSAWAKSPILPEEIGDKVNAFENKVLEYQIEVKTLRDNAIRLYSTIKTEVEGVEESAIKTLNINEFETCLANLANFEQQLTVELKAFSDDFDANSELKKVQSDLLKTSDLKNAAETRDQIQARGQRIKHEIEQKKPLLETKTKELEVLGKEKAICEAKKIGFEEIEKAEAAKMSLEGHRAQLKEGEACPLCGATEHPYSSNYENLLAEIQKQIVTSKDAILKNEKLEREIAAVLHAENGKLEQLQKEREKLLDEFKINNEKVKILVVDLELQAVDLASIAALQKELDAKITAIQSWVQAKNSIKVVQRLSNLFEELISIKLTTKEKETYLKTIYSGSDVQEESKSYLKEWESITTQIKERKGALVKIEQDIIGVGNDVELLNNSILEALNSKGITSLDDAKLRILDTDTLRKIKDQSRILQEQETTIRAELTSVVKDIISSESERTKADLAEELVREAFENSKITLGNLQVEWGSERGKLALEEGKQKQFANLSANIEEGRVHHKKWELLKRYIGDANGNTFSNFAQSLTLKNLISMANARLRHLSDRYILDRPQNDVDALFVLDTYQGNVSRAVNTLSGGETFTISLALALALSDLASRNVKIDSLFIDEGFGTLDSETLESAVETLERLQYESHKTVGVISHRPEMKERIPVQIQVDKGEDGNSQVKVITTV